MDLCSFIMNIIEFCCSLFASVLSYWPVISDLSSSWSLPMEQTWMLPLDFICSISTSCVMVSNRLQHLSTHFPAACFVSSRFHITDFKEFRTIMALGTPPLISIVVSIFWIFDVVGRLCFAISAILAGISSSILSIVLLWRGRTSGDWLVLVLLRNILGVVSGIVGLLMGIRQHNILFKINSMVVFVFGFVQLGVALFAHEIHGIPWFSQRISNPLPFEYVGPSES